MNVVNSIRKGDLINKIEIIRVGERAKAFDAEKVFRTDSLALEQLEKAEELQLLAKQKKEENEKYIAENYIDYKKLDSGIYKKITKQGQGPQVVEEDAVLCNFTLKLLSGIQLESSNPLNPAQFIVVKGRALPGIYEALKTVKVGESASFIIPPDLAFGEKQMGPITPFSYIIFDLDVKEIKKPRVP
ncbi:MAG: FKBP-type peptidyl-prolyl cis-trans isomerase [Lentisphaeria bacterium]|nr:FKBP-type peptidyl-prolyl cis-trans isomerase [Lentisphaeria bacterium]